MSDRDRNAGDADGTIDWPTPGDPPSAGLNEQPTVMAPTHRPTGAPSNTSSSAEATDATHVRPQMPFPSAPCGQHPGTGWQPPHGMPTPPPPPVAPYYPGAFGSPMNTTPPQQAGAWPSGGVTPQPSSHKKWWIIGSCAAVAVALVAVGVLTFARSGTGSTPPLTAHGPSTTSSTSAPPSTTPTTATSAAVPPVQPDQLSSFLLPAADISAAVGNPNPPMRAAKVETALISDGQYTPAKCASTYGPAEQSAYASSGYTGVAAQGVNQGADGTNRVIQAVISFPSAQAAADYYKQTFEQWKECAGLFVTANILDLPPSRIQVDTKPSDMSGTLFLSIIPEFKMGQPFRFCSRSMTAANNVIVDVRSCITDTSASLASTTISRSIARKITG